MRLNHVTHQLLSKSQLKHQQQIQTVQSQQTRDEDGAPGQFRPSSRAGVRPGFAVRGFWVGEVKCSSHVEQSHSVVYMHLILLKTLRASFVFCKSHKI